MSEGELIKLLKSLDFVTEAQEFRVSSIDGNVSFPSQLHSHFPAAVYTTKIK